MFKQLNSYLYSVNITSYWRWSGYFILTLRMIIKKVQTFRGLSFTPMNNVNMSDPLLEGLMPNNDIIVILFLY